MTVIIGRNFRRGRFCDLAALPLMAEFRGGRRVLVRAEKGIVIGDNVTLGSHVTVNGGVRCPTRIGDECYLWHGVNIGHDCQVGARTIINVGSILCGEVTIGEYSYIAPGVVIQPRCVIGSRVVVGTGSNVIHDTMIPDGEAWFGNPAKFQRVNKWRPPT